MKMRKELMIAAGLVCFCLLNFFYLIPSQVEAEGSKTTYPHLLNIMLAVFAAAYGYEAYKRLKVERAEGRAEGDPGPAFMAMYGRTLLLIGTTAVWLFVMGVAGFILSTFFFLIAAAFIFGNRSIWKSVLLGLIMPFVFYGVFRGLNSMLPEGPVEAVLNKLLG